MAKRQVSRRRPVKTWLYCDRKLKKRTSTNSGESVGRRLADTKMKDGRTPFAHKADTQCIFTLAPSWH